MRSMKRVRLAVLFLIAAALLAGTPMPAMGGGFNKLTPPLTSDEPRASGQARLSGITFLYPDPSGQGGWWCMGTWTVTCKGLRPGAIYYYCFRDDPITFDRTSRSSPASKRGTWQAENVDEFPFRGKYWVGVYRDDGPLGTTCVLSGYVYP